MESIQALFVNTESRPIEVEPQCAWRICDCVGDETSSTKHAQQLLKKTYPHPDCSDFSNPEIICHVFEWSLPVQVNLDTYNAIKGIMELNRLVSASLGYRRPG